MAERKIDDASPGGVLFPEYAGLYDLIASEIEGLSDRQLDFESDRWEWSRWSIRRQLSHMASLVYRWLILRWGDVLYPDGGHGVEDVRGIADSDYDRRMDEVRYWDISVVMAKLRQSIELAEGVLGSRSVGFLRAHTVVRDQGPQWVLMARAHATGVGSAAEPGKASMTLEATMRHIYFEEITHLYNIQRLKRAQGLPTIVDLPRVGYWVQDGWDRSEP